jgi:carbon starvation protein CstA
MKDFWNFEYMSRNLIVIIYMISITVILIGALTHSPIFIFGIIGCICATFYLGIYTYYYRQLLKRNRGLQAFFDYYRNRDN